VILILQKREGVIDNPLSDDADFYVNVLLAAIQVYRGIESTIRFRRELDANQRKTLQELLMASGNPR
jgi:hypothetical protein